MRKVRLRPAGGSMSERRKQLHRPIGDDFTDKAASSMPITRLTIRDAGLPQHARHRRGNHRHSRPAQSARRRSPGSDTPPAVGVARINNHREIVPGPVSKGSARHHGNIGAAAGFFGFPGGWFWWRWVRRSSSTAKSSSPESRRPPGNEPMEIPGRRISESPRATKVGMITATAIRGGFGDALALLRAGVRGEADKNRNRPNRVRTSTSRAMKI